ncbi:hypothetical protein BpHYR1_005996 [Brachionus plicatilis]|uniref:Uncharacterized protein n=1 Tax=Brachionus plicatilis TaxID=10195 RepID=A0A3M7SWP2_BRAPC|nr:hypothetical protein BpHYR1_005996 [Brachionus plicatilis]
MKQAFSSGSDSSFSSMNACKLPSFSYIDLHCFIMSLSSLSLEVRDFFDTELSMDDWPTELPEFFLLRPASALLFLNLKFLLGEKDALNKLLSRMERASDVFDCSAGLFLNSLEHKRHLKLLTKLRRELLSGRRLSFFMSWLLGVESFGVDTATSVLSGVCSFSSLVVSRLASLMPWILFMWWRKKLYE